jgi:uncharacterized protein (DUF2141 family)
VSTSTCAVLAFEDEEENGERYRNFIGIPSENYSFSRDARGKFRLLSFEDAAILVHDEPTVTAVKLHRAGTSFMGKSSTLMLIYTDFDDVI